jgi:hypothetical protein
VARAFANDDYILLAESAPFSVSVSGGATVSTDHASYAAGATVTVTYAGLPGSFHDWIAIAPAGSPNTSVVAFVFANGQTSGTATFSAPTGGTYVARAFANDDYILLAESAPFASTNPPAFDDFNRADETPLAVGGNWQRPFGGGVANLTNQQVAGVSGEVLYYWQGPGTFDPAHQSARLEVVQAGGQVGLVLLGAPNQALVVAWNAGTLYFYWYSDGTYRGNLTTVSSTLQNGDVIEALLEDGIVYAKINGTIVGSVANTTTLTSGTPGFETFQGGAVFDNWE